jgi:hypothetical protein
MYYYSPSTRGFYSKSFHGEDIPTDAMEITEEEHTALMQGQSEGKQITPGSDGRPILTDPPPADPIPVQTPEEKLAALGLTKEDLKALLA